MSSDKVMLNTSIVDPRIRGGMQRPGAEVDPRLAACELEGCQGRPGGG